MNTEIESEVLGALKILYLKQLKGRLFTLEQAQLCFQLGQASPTAYKSLGFEVHRLNGTGATYGFPKISKAAKVLEEHLETEVCELNTVVKYLATLITAINDTLVDSTSHAQDWPDGYFVPA